MTNTNEYDTLKVEYSENMDEEEMWAFMFQSSDSEELSREDKILNLMKKQEEIEMLVECTSEIQRSEKEWLEDFNQRRLEHNKASQQARWKEEAEQRGETKGRKEKEVEDILAVSKYMTINQIAEAFNLDTSYIQSIIDTQFNK